MSRSYEMVDDVGGRSITTSTAEPLTAGKAPYYGTWIVDPTISKVEHFSDDRKFPKM